MSKHCIVINRLFTDPTTTLLIEVSSPRIEFVDLEAATNGWEQSLVLGKGGFGTVFKGTWKNTTVAIKKLENQVCLFRVISLYFRDQ